MTGGVFREQVNAAPEDDLSPLVVVQVWGELGIARWFAGDRSGAYAAWKSAVNRILDSTNDTKHRRILFRVMGNFTGYFALMTQAFRPTEWENAVPEPGILLKFPEAVLELYEPGRDWLICAQMALFADGVGAFDDAMDWASRLPDSPTSGLTFGMKLFLQQYRVPRLLKEGHLTEIVQRAAAQNSADIQTEVSAGSSVPDPAKLAQFGEFAAKLNLVAVAIELARRWLRAATEAAEMAAGVNRACQELAIANKMPWLAEVGTEIVTIPETDETWRNLYDHGAKLMNADSCLGVICYIAAMLRAGPRDALQLQLAIVLWLRNHLRSTMFHFTFSALLVEYWNWAIDKFPAHFSNPTINKAELAATTAKTGEDRARTVLNVAMASLNVRPETEELRTWLALHA